MMIAEKIWGPSDIFLQRKFICASDRHIEGGRFIYLIRDWVHLKLSFTISPRVNWGWLAIQVCLELNGYLVQETYSAKAGTVSDKPGLLVHLGSSSELQNESWTSTWTPPLHILYCILSSCPMRLPIVLLSFSASWSLLVDQCLSLSAIACELANALREKEAQNVRLIVLCFLLSRIFSRILSPHYLGVTAMLSSRCFIYFCPFF